jgi:hypothetical protein
MTVTPHDPKEGDKKKQRKRYHLNCWMQIAPKDEIYEIYKAYQKHKEKRNLNKIE